MVPRTPRSEASQLEKFGTIEILQHQIANVCNEALRHCRIGKVTIKPAVRPYGDMSGLCKDILSGLQYKHPAVPVFSFNPSQAVN